MKKTPLALIVAGLVGVGLFRYLVLSAGMGIAKAALIAPVAAFVVAWLVSDALLAWAASLSLLMMNVMEVAAVVTQDRGAYTMFALMLLATPFVCGLIVALSRKTAKLPMVFSFFLQTAATLFATAAEGHWRPLVWGAIGASLITLVALTERFIPSSPAKV